VIRTRSPLSPGQALVLARLACIRRAASVRPEPGSNSPSRSRVPPGINRGFLRSESCLRRSLNLLGNLCRPERVRGRHGIDMWVPFPDRDRTTAPALALGFHCSVFKKRLPESRTKRRVEATLVFTSAGSLAVRDADRTRRPARWRAGRKRWCQPAP
jgi:hypothetical protein